MPRPTPDELIEDLRNLAEVSAFDLVGIEAAETVEGDAADFIAAATPLLKQISRGSGELAVRAQDLLDGSYPAAGVRPLE